VKRGHNPEPIVRRRRAKRFLSTKDQHVRHKQLQRLEEELQCLLVIARTRGVSVSEGKEIIRLTSKAKKLRRKLGLPPLIEAFQENSDAQNIPS
jgi:hypothetical protein